VEARLFWKQQVAGSIPVIQTIYTGSAGQRRDSKSCLVGSIPTARAIDGEHSVTASVPGCVPGCIGSIPIAHPIYPLVVYAV
jgi:hypothetical protein